MQEQHGMCGDDADGLPNTFGRGHAGASRGAFLQYVTPMIHAFGG